MVFCGFSFVILCYIHLSLPIKKSLFTKGTFKNLNFSSKLKKMLEREEERLNNSLFGKEIFKMLTFK